LSAPINKITDVDLVLCGQQASDWDNAHIPMGLAENLNLPCITSALNIEHAGDKLLVQSALPDGYQTLEAPIQSVITVNNLFGEPRYPTLKGIMQASRKSPEVWSIADLEIPESDLKPSLILSELKIPISEGNCEIIEGEDDADSGRLLALKLREEKII
jgi:electron transfer flavoprotein beta subunit